jgi:hydroxymethylpyrimidine pyrophosphatase-like HAD family hydrolase
MMGKYPVDGEVIPVEHKGDEVISYMSLRSIELLQEFNEKHLFVPVTTRAISQYERINVFQKLITPQFAITSNGGTLLIDGKQDEEWDKLIRSRLSITSLPNEDMLKAFAKIRHEEWIEEQFYIDELFYMFLVKKEHMPLKELEAFGKELFELGWRMFLNGRKLYVLPYNLNKAFAVSYLQSYVNYDIHAAAGDSVMDYDMLIQADIGYSPPHGELFARQGNDPKVKWLTVNGATSTEELISNLLCY